MPTHAPPFPCCPISNTTSATATPTTAHGARMSTGHAHSPHAGALTHMPEQKKTGYSGQNKDYFANYKQYELGVGAEFSLTPQSGLFANFDATRKAYPEKSSSSKEYTTRLGAYSFFQAVLISIPSCFTAAVFMTRQVLSATTDGDATINTS